MWIYSGASIGRRVQWGSRGITRARLSVVGLIWVRLGSLGRASGRQVHSGSRGFTRAQLEVVMFIRVFVGSLGRTYVSSGSIGFAKVHSCPRRGRRVLSGSHGFTREC